MTVELHLITPDDAEVRAALLGHRLPPKQQLFVPPPVETLPLGDLDPRRRMSVAIIVDHVAVGMFALDRGGYFREFDDDPAAVLLRAFYIAPEHQGHGFATEAVAATRAFVQQHLPDVRRIVLTVNHQNPAAIATYLKGGFVQTGESYLGSSRGPQHIMVLEV